MSILEQLKTDGVLSLYHDYRSGNTLDLSGNSNNGTITNNARVDNKGLVLKASSDIVSVTGSSDFNSTSMTILIYCDNPKNNSLQFQTMTGRSSVNQSVYFRTDTQKLGFYNGTYYESDVVTDDIRCVAFSISNGNPVKFYVNGVYHSASALSPTVTGTSNNLSIGGDFSGSIIQSKVHAALYINSRVLTDTEISQLYSELENTKYSKKVATQAMPDHRHIFWSDGNGVENLYYNGVFPAPGLQDFSFGFEAKLPDVLQDYDLSFGCSYFGSAVRFYTFNLGGTIFFAFAPEAATLYQSGINYITLGVNDGDWHSYAVYVDRDGDMTVYVDSVLVPSLTKDVSPSVNINIAAWTNYFRIGSFGKVGNAIQGSGNTKYRNGWANMNGTNVEYLLDGNGNDTYGNYNLTHDRGSFPFTDIRDLYFQTEYGALANTKTLTAGYIENTPFFINSGSFRVVTDTYNTHTVKSIECVSGGSFDLKGYYEGSTWSFYYDSGAGYAISDGSGIVSGSTFTMSAGDKLMLADVTGDYNLNKS